MDSRCYEDDWVVLQSTSIKGYLCGLSLGKGKISSLIKGYFSEVDSILLAEVIVISCIFLLWYE